MFLHYTGLINDCDVIVQDESVFKLGSSGVGFADPTLLARDICHDQSNALGGFDLLSIPTMVDGDLVLADTSLICEFLNDRYTLNGGKTILHRGQNSYYQQQRVNTTASLLMHIAVANVNELQRDTEHSIYWLGRWRKAMKTALKSIDLASAGSVDAPNMATFGLAAALSYLDFRLDSHQWRNANSSLASWLLNIEAESWFIETAYSESA